MLAEDLMLLLIDETDGRVLADSTSVENALAGAVLLDLVNSGRVGFGPDGKKLQVLDSTPLNDLLLDSGLSRLDGPVKPQRAVERLRHKVRDKVMTQLADQQVLRLEKSKVLGIFPKTDWEIIDPSRSQAVRADVAAVLRGETAPEERTGALISLVHAVKAVHKVVDGDRKQLTARAKEISEGNWAGKAVKGAVQAVQASIMAAITASTVAATAGGSSGS